VNLIAVDPWDCGCNECTWGEYVPLRMATDEHIADLFAGRLGNNLITGTKIEFVITYETVNDTMKPVEVTARYEHHDGESREWTPDLYRMGLAA
jgi:hypothetical protein